MTNAERQQKWRDRQRALRERYVTGAGVDRDVIRNLVFEIVCRRWVNASNGLEWPRPGATLDYVEAELERILDDTASKEMITTLRRKLGELEDEPPRGEVSPAAASTIS